jgi:hypothetical protein
MIFIKVVKKQLQLANPPQAINLTLADGGDALERDAALPSENIARTALFINVREPSALSTNVTSNYSISQLRRPNPHQKRKQRWKKLNKVLDRNQRKPMDDFTGYSYASWVDFKDILETKPYIQATKPIPPEQINVLSEYLSMAVQSFYPMYIGGDTQRLHLIAPILF